MDMQTGKVANERHYIRGNDRRFNYDFGVDNFTNCIGGKMIDKVITIVLTIIVLYMAYIELLRTWKWGK